MSFANCAIGCAVAGLCLLNSDPVAAEQSVALSLPEARSLAVHALKGERPALASQIARGLLIADPHSAYAHYVLATAHADMGHGTDGRKSAARAYRYADNRVQKFQAAELAARLTFADGHPTLTQLWLRRAVQNAPTPEIEEQLARDYARVRRENPLRFSITGGVKPSSNVNNGADTAQQVIDGLPFTGRLSGSAQALSGIVGTVDAVVGYRLRSTQKTRTDLSGRLFVQRVALDSGSHDLAPEARNSDFGATYADISLRQSFAVGAAGGSADVTGSLGEYWSGGDRSYSFMRVGVGRRWQLSASTSVSMGASLEKRFSERTSYFDSNTVSLIVGSQHRLAWGDGIGVSVNLRETNSDFVNYASQAASLRLSYSFADQIGPAVVNAGLTLGKTDYDTYFAVFDVPGGKQDYATYADVNIMLPDVDYAGFAPSVTLRAGRTRSNVSRFETSEFSVSLGFQSKF